MRAVILAAGVGSRLMPLTRNTPKSLIDLGDGFTLLERQLQSLGACRVADVTLVTGYLSDQIEAKIRHFGDFRFKIVYNPFYRMANNIVSAWMGLSGLDEPAILVNGDDLFRPKVVGDLLRSTAGITLVTSRKETYDQEDMKVVIEEDRILDIGKDIPVERANGESVGIMLFQGRGLADMQGALLDMVRVEENLQLFYLAAIRGLARTGYAIRSSPCSPDDWSELDFHPDLELMKGQMKRKLADLF